MTLQPLERLLWVDIETTGLDPTCEALLEVGLVLTDLDLRTIDGFHVLIWDEYSADSVLAADDFVKNMHKTNGLFDEAAKKGISLDEAEKRLGAWLDKNELGKEDPLCGSTVRFDRGWLEFVWPDLMKKLSHRVIDNSSLKELCRRYNPVLYSKLQKDVVPERAHRVLPDLIDTVEEFQFYCDNFLFWKD